MIDAPGACEQVKSILIRFLPLGWSHKGFLLFASAVFGQSFLFSSVFFNSSFSILDCYLAVFFSLRKQIHDLSLH